MSIQANGEQCKKLKISKVREVGRKEVKNMREVRK
jgi:hypothetical protein